MGVSHMSKAEGVGDEDSFAWFFTAEYPHVVRLLSVVLRDRAAAEDVAQEAFVRLYRHWAKVSRYEAPEAWVRRVALNCAFSVRRREARRVDREAMVDPFGGSGLRGPDTERTDIVRAIRKLPPRDRALIGLYHLEDRPVADVADLLGMRAGAVKVALHRARRRLAVLLTEAEVPR